MCEKEQWKKNAGWCAVHGSFRGVKPRKLQASECFGESLKLFLSLLAFITVCYQIAAACQGPGADQDQFYVNCLWNGGSTFCGYTGSLWDNLGITVKSLHFKISLSQSSKYIFWFYSQIKRFFEEKLDVSAKISHLLLVMVGGRNWWWYLSANSCLPM